MAAARRSRKGSAALSFAVTWLLRCLAALPLLLSCHTGAVLADDYKEATERAYCAGVHQASIEDIKKIFGPQSDTRDAELKKFKDTAYVEGAIRRRIIDADTSSRMIQVGYADAELCSRKSWQCMQEGLDRANRNVDLDLSQRQYDGCMLPVNPVCDRAYKNCD
jgi:hypothetical protein